jgi:2-keto-4-pentenoate hydratase/2-oxohepta-3-ene-1,7-dioic acid hydratase in catechol pathway
MNYQNIWGVGRNFKSHAREMNSEIPATPLIFLKSGASVNRFPNRVCLPRWVQEVHHEVELAVQISALGQPLYGTLALDLTERHFQNLAKKNGHPWTLAKSFKEATVLAPWMPWNPAFLTSDIGLKINGVVRQHGTLNDLIFPLEKITSYLLEHFPICEGDVLLMGTPSGVGPIKPGDHAEAHLGNFLTHQWTIEIEGQERHSGAPQ